MYATGLHQLFLKKQRNVCHSQSLIFCQSTCLQVSGPTTVVMNTKISEEPNCTLIFFSEYPEWILYPTVFPHSDKRTFIYKSSKCISYKHTQKHDLSLPLYVSVHPCHRLGVNTPNLKLPKIQLITILIIYSIQQLNLIVQRGLSTYAWVHNISKVLHIIVIYVVWCKQFTVYTRRLIFYAQKTWQKKLF